MGSRARGFALLFITAFLLTEGLTLSLSGNHALAAEKTKRSKVIDFEDEVVEGMNKRPLDSLSQVGDGSKRKKKPHLYRKRVGFRAETQETLTETRYAE